MAEMRCPVGHRYDTSRYRTCPQCAGASPGTETRAAGYVEPPPAAPDASRPRTMTQPRRGATYAGGMRAMTKVSWQSPPASPRTAPPPEHGDSGSKRPPVANQPMANTDPVVGWLVAYDGPLQGADFRIRCGNNSLGRDPTNRICVYDGDTQIHRKPHAFIVYDPITNTYALRAGDQQKLVYVREETSYGAAEAKWTPVWNAIELKPYDEIKMGSSKFVFVPLCGEHFKWEL